MSPLGVKCATSTKPTSMKPICVLSNLHINMYPLDSLFQPSIFFTFWYLETILEMCFCQAASKEDLIPPVPILTRYKKEAGIKAFVKKELMDPRLPDERKSSEINVQTTPTLCVQLNTLYVSTWLQASPFLCFYHN